MTLNPFAKLWKRSDRKDELFSFAIRGPMRFRLRLFTVLGQRALYGAHTKDHGIHVIFTDVFHSSKMDRILVDSQVEHRLQP